MSMMALLIVVSLAVALGFFGAFVWAVRAGQFDDGATPAIRILLDDAAATATIPTDSTDSTNSTTIADEPN